MEQPLPSPATRPPRPRLLLADALVLGGLVLLGLFASQLAGAGLILWGLDGDLESLNRLLADPESFGSRGRYFLLTLQGLATVGTFVLPPVLLVWRFRHQSLWSLSPRLIKDNMQLLWAVLLVPALAPLLELTITWNKNLSLPASLEAFELWAQAKEDQLARLTEYLIAFDGFGQFLLGLFVIAVLPALGEELLFRGTLQPMLQRATGSPHRAIWLTAIVFSAIHVQFYGFVPRMLLGALFGYLYYWSGNISIPILAHFTNNGITVVLSYLQRSGQTSLDPDNLPAAPLPVLLASVVAGAAVLYRFRARYFVPTMPPAP